MSAFVDPRSVAVVDARRSPSSATTDVVVERVRTTTSTATARAERSRPAARTR